MIIQNVSSFRTNDNLIYYIIDSDLQKPPAVNIKKDNKQHVDKKARSFFQNFIPYFSQKSY